MGEEILIKGKVVGKSEIEADWQKSNYIPAIGESVFYKPDSNYNYTRQKIGDGKRRVRDLPFSSDGYKSLFSKYGNDEYIESGYIVISIPQGSAVEIDIDQDYYADHSHYYIQIQCDGGSHSHEIISSSFRGKIYTDWVSWYIPWTLDRSGVGIDVYARTVSSGTSNTNNIYGSWVPKDAISDLDKEGWYEV